MFRARKEYSTAEKIITQLLDLIRSEVIANHPSIKKLRDESQYSVILYVACKNNLNRNLGETLKHQLPVGAYSEYQKLTISDKNNFRKEIAVAFLNALKSRLDLSKLSFTSSVERYEVCRATYDEDLCISVYLPEENTTKEAMMDFLNVALKKACSTFLSQSYAIKTYDCL